jgi:hypothetical protein
LISSSVYDSVAQRQALWGGHSWRRTRFTRPAEAISRLEVALDEKESLLKKQATGWKARPASGRQRKITS